MTLAVATAAFGLSAAGDYPIRPAAMTKTRLTRGFWFDRLETNRTATLKADWAKCNETPRVGRVTVDGLVVRGESPKELVKAISFDDINHDSRSSGKGTIGQLTVLPSPVPRTR